MSSISSFLLTQIVAYGAPIFSLALMLGALGVPFPVTLFVIAAGAFVHDGVLNLATSVIFGLAGTLLGDNLGYALGRFGGNWARRRWSKTTAWKQAEQTFVRWGGMAIFLSRFLLLPIALPVTLLAGTQEYPFLHYLLYDISGEIIWIFGYGALGYIFSSQWELVGQLLSDFGGFLVGAILLGVGLWLGYKWLKS